jgi:hypothetical protein
MQIVLNVKNTKRLNRSKRRREDLKRLFSKLKVCSK